MTIIDPARATAARLQCLSAALELEETNLLAVIDRNRAALELSEQGLYEAIDRNREARALLAEAMDPGSIRFDEAA